MVRRGRGVPARQAQAAGRADCMNSKGVLFTAMALFLLLSLLSLHQAGLRAGYSSQGTENMLNSYNKVADKFSNARRSLMVLTSNTAEQSVAARVLPFSYSLDSNRLTVTSILPVRQGSVDAYLESLNYLRVFEEDTNYANQYDSLRVDINTLTPKSWGGTDTNVSFALKPQCMRYSILDNNSVRLDFTCSGFDFNAVKKIDVNITFAGSHDFNALSCLFGGSLSCPNNAYSPESTQPYLNLTLIDSNCPKCSLSQKSVGVHFNPDAANYVQVHCSDALCISPPIDLNFGRAASFKYAGPVVGIAIGVDLNSEISSFELSDTNILVSDDYFGVSIWN